MPGWTWLVPGPLSVASLDEIRVWLGQIDGGIDRVAFSQVEVGGVGVDPFALCAGLADEQLATLCVAAHVGEGRIPTILGRELISLDHLRRGDSGLVVIGAGAALAESARIIAGMLGDGPVSGEASAVMPAAFAFENRPGPVDPGGPPVVVLDASQRTASLHGEQLPVDTISAAQMQHGPWTASAASQGLVVVREDALSPHASLVALSTA